MAFFRSLLQRWNHLYRRSSIQMILSASFTAVAVVGMVFLGLTLFFRFSSTTNTQMAENSQRVLAQVNLNLDNYLRSMMRVSDTAYYRVIKDLDLEQDDLSRDLELLYESNRDSLVSIAVFSSDGRLIASSPGFSPLWKKSKISTFLRLMFRISLQIRITATAGWSP